jgi:thiol-disulfide isomerase/thioredoxin
VRKAGDVSNLLSASYTLSKDQHYTAIIWGRETALRLSTLPEDEADSNITTGSRIRFFNATTDSGTVDVYLTNTVTDIGEATPTQGGVAAGSLSGFRDWSAGTWRLRVTGVGDPNDVRLDIPSITLAEKKHHTLVLTAGASGVLLNGTLIQQQGAATTLKNVYDVTEADFQARVLERSLEVPVLLDCWAPWCGPCRSLRAARCWRSWPRPTAAASSWPRSTPTRRPTLSAALRIRSIPLVVLFVGGRPVDQFTGALPEGQIRAFLDKHLQPAGDPVDALREQAAEADARRRRGDAAQALQMVPGHPDVPRLDLAER